MFRFTIREFVTVIVALAAATSAKAELVFNSYALKNDYVTTISDEALDKSPAWNPGDENPPVSARKALGLANALADKLERDSADYRRTLEGIQLCPAGDRWYWKADYVWVFRGASTGVPPHLTLVILMDGTVIQPKTLAKGRRP